MVKKRRNNFALGIVGLLVIIALALAYYGPTTGVGMATAKCSDWDNGYNPVYQGTCTDANGIAYTDTCVGPGVVKEHYCVDDARCISQLVTCEYGCENGACI